MRDENANKTVNVRIDISEIEKQLAKRIAKKQGFTFQGWLGKLVRKELEKNMSKEPDTNINLRGDAFSTQNTFSKS